MSSPQTNADPSRFVVRFQDVARELGIAPSTLRSACKRGEGPPLLRLTQRCYGVRRGDLEAWKQTRDVIGPKV